MAIFSNVKDYEILCKLYPCNRVDVNMISSEASSVVIDIAQCTQKKTQTVRPPNVIPYVQKRFKDIYVVFRQKKPLSIKFPINFRVKVERLIYCMHFYHNSEKSVSQNISLYFFKTFKHLKRFLCEKNKEVYSKKHIKSNLKRELNMSKVCAYFFETSVQFG